MNKLFHKKADNSQNQENEKINFKLRFSNFGSKLFGKTQNLARAIVFPIAVLPIAGLLLGIGGGIEGVLTIQHPNAVGAIGFFHVLKASGDVVFANLGVIFAVSIAFGFAKQSKGVAALSGFITFAVMSSVIAALFVPHNGKALFDPWNLTNHKPFDDDTVANSGIFKNVLGIPNTLDASVLGGMLVGWLVAVVHNRCYNIKMPKVLAFFAGERFVPIVAVFLGIGMGAVMFFAWPALIKAFQAIGTGMGKGMNLNTLEDGVLNGAAFKPTAGGAFIAMFFGITERLLIPTGLHHVQYTPFWFTDVGGHWANADGAAFSGAYSIFFGQFGSGLPGHLDQTPGTMFMSGRFAFMQYGYPFAALAMWKLSRPENRKMVAGVLGSAALTSFLTGITEPILFSFLFVAPWAYVFDAFMAGISFMMAYLFNVVVGQGFAAGFIDFTFFGIVPHVMGMKTGFYWIFVAGALMMPSYYFGFYYIIKWKKYQTLGRENSQEATNLAMQATKSSLEKNTKDAVDKITNLLNGLGGKDNILDVIAEDQILQATLVDVTKISKAAIRLSDTKTIKIEDKKVLITYLNGAQSVVNQLQAKIQQAPVSNQNNPTNKKMKTDLNRLEAIFEGLGGRDNITVLDNCATRLRVTVIDLTKVNDDILKSTGAIAVVKKGTAVQVIYGLDVPNIKNDLAAIWKV